MNGKHGLDQVDCKILALLQENGRMTNVKLAGEVGLSPPTVLERVRKLEDQGIIQKYVALLDPAKVGKGLTAFVLVTLSYHSKRNIARIQKELLRDPKVQECYYLAGEGDFLLKVVVSDIAAYRDFLVSRLTGVEGVQRMRTMIVFDTLKHETMIDVDQTQEV